MTVFEMRVSTLQLNDVNRRSLYISVTVFGKTAWISWWPRPTFDTVPGTGFGLRVTRRPFLTAGTR